jgi:F0F1-type ATP synthase delta subunit
MPKIKPKIYAELLLEAIKEKADNKKVAANFWQILQKNKQYKDMSKILDLLDQEYAKQNGMVLAKIFSETKLDEATITEIKNKIERKFGQKVSIRNIVKENWGGITVEVDDKIVDLSILGKINNLKRKLSFDK